MSKCITLLFLDW